MKIFRILAIAITALSLQSCLHDDKEVFDLSASERIQKAVDDTRALLTSSSNGWLLTFYTGTEYTGAGYNMLIRFKESTAEVSSDFTDPDYVCESSWDIKKDQGVVISFDTYNEILHLLSVPSTAYVDGQEADYEFVVLESAPDLIRLRGKKWGNHMTLARMQEGVEWSDYLSDCLSTVELLGQNYTTQTGTPIFINSTSHRIYAGNDNQGMTFIATPEGIQMPMPYEMDGKEVDFIRVARETGDLICDALGKIDIVIPPLSQQIQSGMWFFYPRGMSERTLLYFMQAVNGSAGEGETIGWMYLGNNINNGQWGINFISGPYAGGMFYKVETIDDNTVRFTQNGRDGNGGWYYSNAGYNYIDFMFAGSNGKTWKLSTDNERKPTWILFENPDNADEYFKLAGEEIDNPFGE